MAEHLLHAAQIGPTVEQMGGHGVPQAVRSEIGCPVDEPQGAVDDPADDAWIEPPSPLADEQRRPGLAGGQPSSALLDPGIDGPDSGIADGDAALLATLAEHPDHPPVPIKIAEIESAELRDPDPGRVKQLEDRDVARRHRPAELLGGRDRLIEHLRRIGTLQRGRQRADRLGRLERRRGTRRNPS